ncbi:MAG: hypothetical protein JEY99_16955 [Spirochaetales bacterium]|nr:hypothetical protein [Spirochaetales bacterium]
MINIKKALLLLLLISIILLASCVEPVDFSEYEDVNFIIDQDFPTTGNDDGEQRWLEERAAEEVTDGVEYMIFEPVSETAAGSIVNLPADAAIYRLEIPNLVPNGDFEEDPLTSGWSEEGATAEITWDAATDPAVIEGRVLDYSHSASSLVKLDTSAFLLPDVQYSLRFDLKLSPGTDELDNMNFEYYYNLASETPAYSWSPVLLGYGNTVIIDFPVEVDKNAPAFTTTESGYFTIGWSVGNSGQEGYMDNLRMTRVDRTNTLFLDIPFSSPDRPDLLSGGTYTFSLYVKKEAADQVTPQVHNRFQAEGLTMGINTTASASYSGRNIDISAITASTWTKVSVSYSNSERVQIYTPADTSASIMTLSIVPTNWNSANDNTAGSILISSPELTWTYDS